MTDGPRGPNPGGYDQWGNPIRPSAPSANHPHPPSGPDQGAHSGQEPQQHGQQPPQDFSQYGAPQNAQYPGTHQNQGPPAYVPHQGQAPWDAPGQAQHPHPQMGSYNQQADYQQQPYGQPPYGYGQPPKSSSAKRWWLIGIITMIVIAIGVIIFVVMDGEDDEATGPGVDSSFVEGLDEFLIELDLTRESAIEEGAMTSGEYDEWRTCLINEGELNLSADLKEKISLQDFEFTPDEQTEFSSLVYDCILDGF